LNNSGEIIFIVPRGFIKLTSALRINNLLFDNVTITDFIDFVCSKTRADKTLKKMIYYYDDCLLQHKEELINRKIRKFNETNWWKWGREIDFNENKDRIYVNCKTRHENPFFINECKRWDGSVLTLFPKENINLKEWTEKLNNENWNELGFKTGERFIFSQKSLSNCYI
jgi:adenine-specific DNA-methyltransferase